MTMGIDEKIKLVGVISDEVGEPRNDGTRGSALYAVPFRLSGTPSATWVRVFVETWNSPPRFTSMHRPGIAQVSGNKIILDKTTIDEVERYHIDTLKLAVAEANKVTEQEERKSRQRTTAEDERRQQHQQHIAEVAKRLKFED